VRARTCRFGFLGASRSSPSRPAGSRAIRVRLTCLTASRPVRSSRGSSETVGRDWWTWVREPSTERRIDRRPMHIDSESGCTQRDTTLTPPPAVPAWRGPQMHEFGRDYQPAFDNAKRRLWNWPAGRTHRSRQGARRVRVLRFRKLIALHQLHAPWCSLKTRRGPASRVPADDSLGVPTAGLGTCRKKSSPPPETPNSPKSCAKRLRIRLVILLMSHLGGVAQSVRALPCHGRGRGFESRRSRFRHPGSCFSSTSIRACSAIPARR
jgi:hypothetical protein